MFKRTSLLIAILLLVSISLFAGGMELTAEDIALRGFRSVGEALSSLAGVEVQSYYGNSALVTVSINGSKGSQVDVYVDGIRQTRDYDGTFNLGLIALSRVESISVDADRGLGGSVYITTRRSASGEVSVSNNSLLAENDSADDSDRYFNGQNVSAYYGGSSNGSGYAIGASYNRDMTAHRISSSSDRTKVEDYAVDGSYSYSTERGSIGLSARYSQNDADTMGSTSWVSNTNTKTIIGGFTVNGDYRLESGLLLKGSLGWQYKAYEYTPYVVSLYDPASHNKTNVFEFDFRAGNSGEGRRLSYSFGINGTETMVQASSIGDHNRFNVGVVADISYLLAGEFLFAIDARVPLNEESEGSVEGSITWYADRATETAVKLKVGYSLAQPNLSALYWPVDYTMYYEGNPDLDPEKVFSASIGLDSRPLKNLKYSGSIFIRHTTDLLAYVTDPLTYMGSYDNVDEALFIGSNQSISTVIREHLSLEASATINYTYNLSGDNDISDKVRVNNVRMHTLKLATGYVSKTISIIGDVQFLGGYYYNSAKQHADTLYGLTVNFSPAESVTLSARLENIFDEDYFLYQGYPMPGTNLTLKSTLRF